MTPFEGSAEFYDDLYEGKDYAAEADYVDALIQRYSPGAQSLLDLGCGIGPLLPLLSQHYRKGYAIDFARGMLERARKAARDQPRKKPWAALPRAPGASHQLG